MTDTASAPPQEYSVVDLLADLSIAVESISRPGKLSKGEAIKLMEIALNHQRDMRQMELAYGTVHYPPPGGTYVETGEDDPTVDHEAVTLED